MSDNTSSQHEHEDGDLAVFAAAADLPLLADLLQRLKRTPAALQAGGAGEAAAWCADHAPVAVLLVDLSGAAHPLQALNELAGLYGPTTQIIALGERQDVDLYRALLQAGAFDYLVKPLKLDLLAATLARAADGTPLGLGAAVRAGRTVAVIGAGGGIGTSTVVAGLGRLLASVRHTPTVLVDFDRGKGDLPLLLGMEADAGLSSVLAAPEIDPRLLQRSLQAVGAGGKEGAAQRLHLLAQRPGPHVAVDPEHVLQLGGALSQLFSLSVWDLPACRTEGVTEVLEHAEIRIVLCEQTVQHARHVHRLLAEIGDESAGQRLLLVANAVRPADRPAISRSQFEEFVGRRIDLHLPHAGSALADGLLAGPLSLARHRGFEQALLALADRVLGRPAGAAAAAANPSWLHRLLGGKAA
ncbi:response regulator [Pseudothauera nasutitermitis]|uniref:Response regulator n=1 Tax=Pseudothauera nasutitermitis TaxID=2565930 RepID=A0A4S4B3K3_9RHOO|nr:response regulator [Pseudothauera nasutitermitis]THF67250.1 response regulator [Pseudothauera nasutitermitis]